MPFQKRFNRTKTENLETHKQADFLLKQLEDLSEDESQAIAGGVGLLLPAIQHSQFASDTKDESVGVYVDYIVAGGFG
jgi:hypothetical protein